MFQAMHSDFMKRKQNCKSIDSNVEIYRNLSSLIEVMDFVHEEG